MMFKREENENESPLMREDLDPVFTAEFFKMPEKVRELEAIDLPFLPTENDKVDSFKSFLNSENGEKFCSYALNLIKEFEEWCKLQHIEVKPNTFDVIRSYFDREKEQHYKTAPLYMNGIGDFASFLKLLKDETIPLDKKRNEALKILEGIALCPSGISDPLADANLELATDIKLKLMAIRRHILKDILINKTFNHLTLPNYGGNQIHYFNVINNLIADELGIEKREDEELIKQCRPYLLGEEQISHFIFLQIQTFFTLEKVIHTIIDDLKINNSSLFENKFEIYREFNIKLETLTSSIDRWGADDSFSFHDLIQNDDEQNQYSLKNDINIILAQTLLKRFENSGYIKINRNKEELKLNDTHVTLYYVPKKSIKFAYIVDGDGEKQPLLTFCLNQIRNGDDSIIHILTEQKVDLFSFPETRFLFNVLMLMFKDACKDPNFDSRKILQAATALLDRAAIKRIEQYDFFEIAQLVHDLLPEKYRLSIISLGNSIRTLNDYFLLIALIPPQLHKEFISYTPKNLFKILNENLAFDPLITFNYFYMILKNIDSQDRFLFLRTIPLDLLQKIMGNNFRQVLRLLSLLDPNDKKHFQQYLGTYYDLLMNNFVDDRNSPIVVTEVLFSLYSPEEFLQALDSAPQNYVLKNLQNPNIFLSIYKALKAEDRFKFIQKYFINSPPDVFQNYLLEGGMLFLTSIEANLIETDKKLFCGFLKSRHIFISDEYHLTHLINFMNIDYDEAMKYIMNLEDNNNFILYLNEISLEEFHYFLNSIAYAKGSSDRNYEALQKIFKKFISLETMKDHKKIEIVFKSLSDEDVFTLCQTMGLENIAQDSEMILSILSNLKHVDNIIPTCAAIGFNLRKNDDLIFKLLDNALIKRKWKQIELIGELNFDYFNEFDVTRLSLFFKNLAKESQDAFIDLIPAEALLKICLDPITLVSEILNAIADSSKLNFLQELSIADSFDSNTFFAIFIRDSRQFGQIVKSFPDYDRLSVFRLFTPDQIKIILEDNVKQGDFLDLYALLSMLPENHRVKFLVDVKDILPVKVLDDVVQLLKPLPPYHRILALNNMSINKIPGNLKEVIQLLNLFDKKERLTVLETLDFPEYIVSPPFSDEEIFNQLKKLLPENDLIIFNDRRKSLSEQVITLSKLSLIQPRQDSPKSSKTKRRDSMSNDEQDYNRSVKHQKNNLS